MSEADRRRYLLDLVRAEAATALGIPTPDAIEPNRSLLELGLDSLMAIELRNRLGAATGLRLPDTLLFTQPTAAEAAAWIFHQLGAEPTTPHGLAGERRTQEPASAEPAALTGAQREKVLVSVFRQMPQDEPGWDLLNIAARIRHARQLEDPSEIGAPTPGPERLALGTTPPDLICFPAILGAGPIQYARFAAAFRESRAVWGLHHPGFTRDGILPKDVASLVQHHVEAVKRCTARAPFALAGHSSGGWIAHAVTSHLERLGIFPTALVLLDTYPMNDQLESAKKALRRRWVSMDPLMPELDDGLIAMSFYGRLFEGWTPTMITTPILLVRATSSFERSVFDSSDSSNHSLQTSWDQPHSAVDVPGDHFSMMEDHVDTTARAVHDWLAALPETMGRSG
jgi:thioesterase domain-containing protein/acyl carrier protein